MAHKDREYKQNANQRYRALGLMSGTSMDGIDLAFLVTDGDRHVERGHGATQAYDNAFRDRLKAALEEAKALRQRDERPGSLSVLERDITLRTGDAVRQFLASADLEPGDVDVIGFHGQTVLHRPQQRLTVQLGDGQLLANQTGIPVIHDMRANDMTLGGQGAPLVPAYHRALAHSLPPRLAGRWPVAFVNIGGIANLTFVPAKGELVALDTGPGNALIDQWVAQKTGLAFDAGGAIGEAGEVVESLARSYLEKPFFERPLPKTLDRNDFLPPAAQAASLADGARTLAHVTARAIIASFGHLPAIPQLVITCGGGRKNRSIMAELAIALDELPSAPRLVSAEEAGFDGDAMEAEAWAYLAVRSLRRLAITFPGTTGVSSPATGGVLSLPR